MASAILQAAKNILRYVPYLRAGYHWVYKKIMLGPTPEDRIGRALARTPTAFFLQIGANDGVKADPIHELIRRNKRWRGLFIEPVEFLFERLKQNYAGEERFRFEMVAIGVTRERRKFYFLPASAELEAGFELPFYFDQLGSFDRQHIIRHLGERIDPFIAEEMIDCLPLQEVLDRNKITEIDLVHIDVEGFDYEVLKQIDFNRYRPRVLFFEHKHLSPNDRHAARLLLEGKGYFVFDHEADTVAILRKPPKGY